LNKIRQVEHRIGTQFAHKQVPTGIEVCEQQLIYLAKKAHDVAVNPDIEQYLSSILETFEDMSKEEVLKSFLSLEFNRFLEYYKNASDLNEGRGSRSEGGRPVGIPMTRYFVGVGELDGIDKSGMVRLLCDTTGLPNDKIGKIELRRSFSFFEVPPQFEHIVESKFEDVQVNGRTIRIEKTTGGGDGGERKRGGGYGGGSGGGKRWDSDRPSAGKSRPYREKESGGGYRSSGGGSSSGGGFKGRKKY
jgi:ATP-dependent RNA helicase DeaD